MESGSASSPVAPAGEAPASNAAPRGFPKGLRPVLRTLERLMTQGPDTAGHEYGTVRFTREGEAATPAGVRLVVPGDAQFGEWTVSAQLGGFGDAELDAAALGDVLTVRAWREGDKMRPLGLIIHTIRNQGFLLEVEDHTDEGAPWRTS